MTSLEDKVCALEIKAEDQEQRSHLENIKVHAIPVESNQYHHEDCYNIIIGLLRHHFNIFIEKQDISICHRQTIPSEKKKLGKHYIPVIYCRFVNRHLAEVVKQFNLLKNPLSIYGKPFRICQNLTLERRKIWDSLENTLETFQAKWVQNGNIFAKKDAHSHPVKINHHKVLEKLLLSANRENNKVSHHGQATSAESSAPPILLPTPQVPQSYGQRNPPPIPPRKPIRKLSPYFTRTPFPPSRSNSVSTSIPATVQGATYAHTVSRKNYENVFTPYERSRFYSGNMNSLLSPRSLWPNFHPDLPMLNKSQYTNRSNMNRGSFSR